MGLAAKMVAIMAAVTHLDKDAKNSFHKYEYTSDGQVYNAVRRAMIENGVAVFTKMPNVDQVVGTTSSGKPNMHTLSRFVFVLQDAESGEREECEWYGEADDQNDKGVNKTATAALKYFLLKTFVIPTGDDPDADEPPAKPASKNKPTGSETAANAEYSVFADKRTFQPDMWAGGMCAAFVATGLADNNAHASKRLRKVYGLEHDATWEAVIATQDEAKFTVAELATAFKSRRNMRELEAEKEG